MKNDRMPSNQNSKHHASGSLVSIVVLGGRDETELLGMAASLACASGHPLGAAILGSGDYRLKLRPVERLQVIDRRGVSGHVDGHDVIIGNATFLAARGLYAQNLGDWADRFTEQGQEVTFVAVDAVIAGLFGITAGTTDLFRNLSPLHGEEK